MFLLAQQVRLRVVLIIFIGCSIHSHLKQKNTSLRPSVSDSVRQFAHVYFLVQSIFSRRLLTDILEIFPYNVASAPIEALLRRF